MLEKILESPLDCKETKPVNPKGNQPLIFIGKSDAKDEASIIWPLDAKNWLTGKDPDSGKDWRQKKVMTEDAMIGWHQWFQEIVKDGEAWCAAVQGITKSWMQLSDWTITTFRLTIEWEGFCVGELGCKVNTV